MTTEDFPGRSEGRTPREFSTTLAKEVAEEEIEGVRDVSFPVVMRGYDRAAVDAYVTRVNRIIAELQVSRSPRSAIRHALDQVSEETRGLLEQAHATAEAITGRSRAQADDRLQRAEEEARALTEKAEMRVTELEADAESVREERSRLVSDVRRVSEQLGALASVAAARFVPDAGEEAETVVISPPAGAGEPESDEDDDLSADAAEPRSDGQADAGAAWHLEEDAEHADASGERPPGDSPPSPGPGA